ncbi:hypothetical protein F383_39469 [Gossypium arboreum]|jgi:hypothetical protein
MSLV